MTHGAHAAGAAAAAQSARGRGWMIAGFVASSIVQLAMIAIGVAFALDESDLGGVLVLLGWCVLGTLYVATTVIILGVMARRENEVASTPSRIEISRPARIVSFSATILASFIGVAAAIQLMSYRSDAEIGVYVGAVGVWAMLLSWGLLHWGFAQIYYQDYYSRPVPTLRFPATEHPRLTDFVYFSFTLGTSFAASDVEVRSSRLRWRVVWHSVISFFFNGLIIVFALNSILAAGQS